MRQDNTDGDLFVLEGALTNLHYERGSANLLAKVDQYYKHQAVITATGAVVGELFGQVANTAMLAMYDGEETQNFVCLIGDQVVCGQFAGAEHFKEGNAVKAVVSKAESVLYMHAAFEETRGLIWTPHPCGTRAEIWSNIRLGLWGYISVMLFIGIAVSFLSDDIFEVIKVISVLGAAAACLVFFLIVWSIRDLKAISYPCNVHFGLLGIEEPETIDLSEFIARYVITNECLRAKFRRPPEWDGASYYEYRDVYSVKAAIAAGKLRMRM
jgi:hypothetical protein